MVDTFIEVWNWKVNNYVDILWDKKIPFMLSYSTVEFSDGQVINEMYSLTIMIEQK